MTFEQTSGAIDALIVAVIPFVLGVALALIGRRRGRGPIQGLGWFLVVIALGGTVAALARAQPASPSPITTSAISTTQTSPPESTTTTDPPIALSDSQRVWCEASAENLVQVALAAQILGIQSFDVQVLNAILSGQTDDVTEADVEELARALSALKNPVNQQDEGRPQTSREPDAPLTLDELREAAEAGHDGLAQAESGGPPGYVRACQAAYEAASVGG